MAEFTMPSLGADMDAGTIVEWRVRAGDRVKRGDVVALVQTDKADIDAEVFEDGVVESILVPPGVKVPVGTPLAVISGASTSRPAAAPVARAPSNHVDSPLDSPLIRHLAERTGVPIGALHGSGPGGRITRADVESFRQVAPSTSTRPRITPRARRLARERGIDLTSLPTDKVITGASLATITTTAPSAPRPPVDTMRAAIGRQMSRSWTEIPHYYLSRRVDLSRALAWMAESNENRPVETRLIAPALIFRAVALAAAETKRINGWYRDGRFEAAPHADLAVATALRTGGLLAPVIHAADTKALDEFMGELRDLVTRARANKLKGSEVTGASITVTNLGDAGADLVYGIIHPPQVAIVGIGAVHEEAWAADGVVDARPVAQLTLAGDHRVSDGRDGAALLARVEQLLKEPERL
ncbi:MAG: dihydrolipoamide acetyltransferase family protein [Acidimicrobiia bacterium]